MHSMGQNLPAVCFKIEDHYSYSIINADAMRGNLSLYFLMPMTTKFLGLCL